MPKVEIELPTNPIERLTGLQYQVLKKLTKMYPHREVGLLVQVAALVDEDYSLKSVLKREPYEGDEFDTSLGLALTEKFNLKISNYELT